MKTPPPQIALAYDSVAQDYDVQLAQNPIASYMRAQLHNHLARIVHPGNCILDLTAGTGADACFLAARGVKVIALDISQAMLAQARRGADNAGVELETHVLPVERLGELGLRDLDAAISTFGGLNTVENLPRLARDLHECLKPQGSVILHALNRFCFWQWARGHTTGRELREVQIGRTRVPHRFYTPHDVSTIFAPYFAVRAAYSLSVVAAPSLVRRWRPVAPALFALDRIAGRAFPAAGDFFVLDLYKR